MTIAVVDGMGGGIGVEIVTALCKEFPEATIMALGTNAVATDRMVQAKARLGATGANAIRVSLQKADFVMGPIGIVLPDGLMGEITSEIAGYVVNAPGKKILLPIHQPHVIIAGLKDLSIKELVAEALRQIRENLS